MIPKPGGSPVFRFSEAEYPYIRLLKDTWDDYGYKTLYDVYLYLEPSNRRELGRVKILDSTSTTTRLPSEFSKLPSNYISLGQDLAYYKTIKELGRPLYDKILRGLNDIVYNKNLSYEKDSGFHSSLTRFSEAVKAYREGGQYFYDEPVTEAKYNFTFSCRIGNASLNHTARFDFDHNSPLPSRINAIIGKNGTGKTQFLAYFANAISGVDKDAGQGEFDPERPSFSKIIAISYSAFDSFKKPPRHPRDADRTFSYHYCGLQDKDGLSLPDAPKFRKLLDLIRERDRFDQWKSIINTVLKENDFQLETDDSEPPDLASLLRTVSSSSSGQSITFYIITNIIAYIENESLLLFDEPEMHLHPNAVSNLMGTLYMVLDTFNSYAIVSTHSPIVLQEIPSKYVSVFRRIGNVPLVQRLEKECFGENLTIITEEVFQVDEGSSNYQNVLEKLSRNYKYEEILSMFDGRLSLNAKLYLNGLYN